MCIQIIEKKNSCGSSKHNTLFACLYHFWSNYLQVFPHHILKPPHFLFLILPILITLKEKLSYLRLCHIQLLSSVHRFHVQIMQHVSSHNLSLMTVIVFLAKVEKPEKTPALLYLIQTSVSHLISMSVLSLQVDSAIKLLTEDQIRCKMKRNYWKKDLERPQIILIMRSEQKLSGTPTQSRL